MKKMKMMKIEANVLFDGMCSDDHRYRELPAKLQRDPGLLERAMLYLRVTGEVHI